MLIQQINADGLIIIKENMKIQLRATEMIKPSAEEPPNFFY